MDATFVRVTIKVRRASVVGGWAGRRLFHRLFRTALDIRQTLLASEFPEASSAGWGLLSRWIAGKKPHRIAKRSAGRQAIPQRTDAIVGDLDLDKLGLQRAEDMGGKRGVLDRLSVGFHRGILAAFALGQNRMRVLFGERRLKVDPSAVERAHHGATVGRLFFSERASQRLQFHGEFAPLQGIFTKDGLLCRRRRFLGGASFAFLCVFERFDQIIKDGCSVVHSIQISPSRDSCVCPISDCRFQRIGEDPDHFTRTLALSSSQEWL
jgi:hypothetical protein